MTIRYAAKLLFGYKVLDENPDSTHMQCESRIVTFHAGNPDEAVLIATELGVSGQYEYSNTDEDEVLFTFLGLIEVLNLDVCTDESEVWYDCFDSPVSEVQKLCKPNHQLNIFTRWPSDE